MNYFPFSIQYLFLPSRKWNIQEDMCFTFPHFFHDGKNEGIREKRSRILFLSSKLELSPEGHVAEAKSPHDRGEVTKYSLHDHSHPGDIVPPARCHLKLLPSPQTAPWAEGLKAFNTWTCKGTFHIQSRLLQRCWINLGLVLYVCDPSKLEAEVEWLWVQGLSVLPNFCREDTFLLVMLKPKSLG